MTPRHMLIGTSLASVLLLSLHLAQDALHARPGTTEAGPGNLVAILILFVLLAGPVLLAERRSGQVLMLLGALFSIGMPLLHFNLGGNLNNHKQALLFVWCLIALGVTGLLCLFLLMSELPRVWRQQRSVSVRLGARREPATDQYQHEQRAAQRTPEHELERP